MAKKKITYGDVSQLLESEGFQPAGTRGQRHMLFRNIEKNAELILPAQRPNVTATAMDIELVERTMVDFGVMSVAQFARWIANPKQFQAA